MDQIIIPVYKISDVKIFHLRKYDTLQEWNTYMYIKSSIWYTFWETPITVGHFGKNR